MVTNILWKAMGPFKGTWNCLEHESSWQLLGQRCLKEMPLDQEE